MYARSASSISGESHARARRRSGRSVDEVPFSRERTRCVFREKDETPRIDDDDDDDDAGDDDDDGIAETRDG